MAKVSLTHMDMTKGNLFWKMGLFSLPMFLTFVFQLLYSTIDLLTVHFMGGGQTSMSAVQANGSLISLIIIVFSNMSLGANVSVANAKGANDREKASKVLHTSIIFSTVSGLGVAVVGYFVSGYLLQLMGTSEHIIDLATIYLKIYFIGVPFIIIYNYVSQIMRALGDSTTPLVILLISGLINVAADILFVAAFHMDVDGVAWATVLSEVVSSVLGVLFFVFSKKSFINLHWKELKIDRTAMKDIVRIGLPAGFQGFFFALPNVFIQAKLYQVDPGNTQLTDGAIASSNIEGYIYAGIEAIYSAAMSFTAQNYGAKNKENIRKVFRYSLLWVFLFCLLVDLIIGFAYQPLLKLYVDTPEAIEAGRQRLWVVGFTYLLDGIMDMFSGSMRGVRHSTFPMVTTLITCTIFRIVMLETVFNIPLFHTVIWLYAVFPASWILADIMDLVGYLILMPKAYKEMGLLPAATKEEAK